MIMEMHDHLLSRFIQTYYSIIRAATRDGSVDVSSDGFQVLPTNTQVIGLQITDGYRCEFVSGNAISM